MMFYKCDRCGETYSPEDIAKYKRSITGQNGYYYTLNGYHCDEEGILQIKDYDLCPKCMEKLKEWRMGYSD